MPDNNRLPVEIDLDIGKASSNLDAFHGKVGQLGAGMSTMAGQATGAVGGVGSSLGALINPATVAVGAVAGVGAALFDSVGKAGEFDAKMAAIRATMQPTGAEMSKLSDLALQLGAATDVGSVSASDAADAIFELGKAGIDADALVQGVARSTLQLAAAAGPEFGVANAASLAADSLNSFGLKAADSTAVVNTLVGAANASSIGLEDMKYGLSAVGAVAHTVGMSFQDTSTALAVFGANGLKGSDAGTSLKTMLLNLNPHTKAATAQMQELGLWTAESGSAFFDSQGHMRSLSEVSELLKTHLAGLSDQQKLTALQTMFGSDAIRAASILSAQGAEGITKMSTAMQQQGDAAKVAGDMSNNLQGKWEAFQGTVETLQIKLGTLLVPALSAVIDAGNNLLGGALAALPGIFDAVGAAIPGVVSAIQSNALPILAMLGVVVYSTVIPAFVAWATAAATAAAGTIAALAPVLLPIAAVGIAVFALKTAWEQNFLGIRDAVMPIVQTVIATLSKFWTEVQPQLVAAWQNIQVVVQNVMTFVGNLITTVMGAITTAWTTNWGGIRDIASGVWNVIKTTVTVAWNLVQGIITTGLAVLQGNWSGAWEGIKGLLNTAWEGMKSILSAALPVLATIVTNFIPTLTTAIVSLAAEFTNWVGRDVLPKLPGVLETIWNGITSWIASTVPKVISKVMEIGGALVQGIRQGVQNAWNAFVQWLGGLVDSLPQIVKDILGIKSPSTVFAEIGKYMMTGWALGIGDNAGLVTGALGDVLSKVTGKKGSGFPGLGGGIGGGGFGIQPVGSGGSGTISQVRDGEPIVVQLVVDGKVLSQTVASRQNSRQVRPSVVLGGLPV